VQYLEITDPAGLRERTSLDGCVLRALDLREPRIDWSSFGITRRTFFMGCRLVPEDEARIRERGAVIFPRFAELPYEPYRGRLYDSAELMEGYDGRSFEASAADQRVYAEYRRLKATRSVVDALAQRLHDASVSDALDDFLARSARFFPRGIVGIMGSHRTARDAAEFLEVARLGHRLTREGFLVVTGGGPGAMEAGNLGAFLAPQPESAIDDAVALLRGDPDAGPPVPPGYLASAQAVLRRFAPGSAAAWGFRGGRLAPSQDDAGWSLAIPTWTYGHEPSNLFASHVAKLFQNSVREEGLVSVAGAGLVFVPGAAGTLQEVFTDAGQNYYASGPHEMCPMAFWPRDYWTRKLPIVECLAKLADLGQRAFIQRVGAFDTVGEVVAFLKSPPELR
jgi:predicted Rossmann-fold nucleotide-binding protein